MAAEAIRIRWWLWAVIGIYSYIMIRLALGRMLSGYGIIALRQQLGILLALLIGVIVVCLFYDDYYDDDDV